MHGDSSTGEHFKDGLIDFIGGVNAGITCVYVGQPLDTIKVKMQTFSHLYSSSVRCFIDTFRQDGVRGLYAGTVPALAANIAENSILFCGYGACQKVVAFAVQKHKISELNAVENALAGSGGAFLASFALCPTELVKCRLQALRETATNAAKTSGSRVTYEATHISPFTMTRNILRTEGIRGLYHGLAPTLMREVPGYFFFFGGYELSRQFLTPHGKTKDQIGPIRTILCGGIGGMTLWTLMFPFDVVKSRAQVQGTGGKSMLGLLVHIARTEGIPALYCGLAPTLVRTFFASGALFVAYEYTKKTLHAI